LFFWSVNISLWQKVFSIFLDFSMNFKGTPCWASEYFLLVWHDTEESHFHLFLCLKSKIVIQMDAQRKARVVIQDHQRWLLYLILLRNWVKLCYRVKSVPTYSFFSWSWITFTAEDNPSADESVELNDLHMLIMSYQGCVILQ
jgi:hypothetical protein